MSLLYIRSNQPMKWLEAVAGIDDSAISRFLREATKVWEKVGFTPPEPDPHWRLPALSEGGGRGVGGGSYSPVVCVDGFLVPCPRPVGWEAQKPYYSPKHKRHGLKMQLVSSDERLACLSPAYPGSTHDARLLERHPVPSDVLEKGNNLYGDKAYPRDTVMRPRKKKEGGYDKELNRGVSSLRVGVEHVIKLVKDFKVMRYNRLEGVEARLVGLGNLIAAALNLRPTGASG